MSVATIDTVTKMMESLPENIQEKIVDHLQEYIEDLMDDNQWKTTFNNTQSQLIGMAQKAKDEIAKGKAKPLDINQL